MQSKRNQVKKEYERTVEIRGNTFNLTAWRDSIFNNLHISFAKGDIHSNKAPLVRVHAPNLVHDLIGINEFGSRLSFEDAIDRIAKEDSGILLLIGNQESPDQLLGNLKGSKRNGFGY